MPDEHTSPKVASLAAEVLSMSDEEVRDLAVKDPGVIRSLAASALTQAEDRNADER